MSHYHTVRRAIRQLKPIVRVQAPTLDTRAVEIALLDREVVRRVNGLLADCCKIMDNGRRQLVVRTIAERLLDVVEDCERVFSLSSR